MAHMLCYELQRVYADRIMFPSTRKQFMQKMVECVKMEFLCGNQFTEMKAEDLLLGDYHQKKEGAHVKQIDFSKNQGEEVRQAIRKKLLANSNNHFLETFLDAPVRFDLQINRTERRKCSR